jgi:hypothetical protein
VQPLDQAELADLLYRVGGRPRIQIAVDLDLRHRIDTFDMTTREAAIYDTTLRKPSFDPDLTSLRLPRLTDPSTPKDLSAQPLAADLSYPSQYQHPVSLRNLSFLSTLLHHFSSFDGPAFSDVNVSLRLANLLTATTCRSLNAPG